MFPLHKELRVRLTLTDASCFGKLPGHLLLHIALAAFETDPSRQDPGTVGTEHCVFDAIPVVKGGDELQFHFGLQGGHYIEDSFSRSHSAGKCSLWIS
jgi:hypothetical protein